jgi:magnesium transporter
MASPRQLSFTASSANTLPHARSKNRRIKAFQKLFLAPGFRVFGGCIIIGSLVIIFYFAPKSVIHPILSQPSWSDHGTKSMRWYIAVCSMIGGLGVSVTTGLGTAIVMTVMGDNQVRCLSLPRVPRSPALIVALV